ncbi:hypothetical protein ACF2JD_01690 [Aeromonas sp. A-5]|uniref:hypothetical protein n=1 Tax=Aeromonas ichthyocola TaxID=3367746 RepID=UPI0038E037E8
MQEFGLQQGWTVNFSMEQDLGQVVIKVMDLIPDPLYGKFRVKSCSQFTSGSRLCVKGSGR